MSRKRKSVDLSDRCRFCLARDDACMSQLFVDSIRPTIDDLQRSTDVELLDKPNYPKRICFICLYKLEMWSEFKSQFLKTNEKILSHFNIFHEPIENKTNQIHNEVTEELSLDNNQKRMRLDSGDALQITAPVPTLPVNKLIQLDLKMSTEEVNKLSPTKSQVSDESVTNPKKSTRFKKVEREASTKRWEERKNALIAATGEVPSESDSENGGDLSPVQKARVKSNQQLEQEIEKQRKLQKALKNLQMDLTEKYKINPEALVETQERKTRSRRSNPEDLQTNEALKASPAKIAKINLSKVDKSKMTKSSQLLVDKVNEAIDALKFNEITDQVNETIDSVNEIIDPVNETIDSVNEIIDPVNETIDPVNEIIDPVDETIDSVNGTIDPVNETIDSVKDSIDPVNEPIDPVNDSIETIDDNIDAIDDNIDPINDTIDPVNISIDSVDPVINEDEASIPVDINNKPQSLKAVSKELVVCNDIQEKFQNIEVNDDIDNEIDVVEIGNEDVTLPQQSRTNFKPQVVTSEVSVGNATYVVTLTLDMPGTSASKSGDISLKTNGINVDTSNKDGKQIDIMNTLQLQKVKAGGDKSSPVKENCNKPDADIQKCLKIEVEGMEVEALQRVQLELAKFVNEDVIDILLNTSGKKKPKQQPKIFKDSYETLDRQLKGIVEKVLRSHYESDKFLAVIKDHSSHGNLSSEFIKAAETSPIFQPKVVVVRINIGEMSKTHNINNIHIMEEIKRKKGLVGPLSRTLGKRRLKIPKKFEDFSLDFNEEKDKTVKSVAKKAEANVASITVNVMDDEVMFETSVNELTKQLDKIGSVSETKTIKEPQNVKLDKPVKVMTPEKTIQQVLQQNTSPKSSPEKKIIVVTSGTNQPIKPSTKVTTITKISSALTNTKPVKIIPNTTITNAPKLALVSSSPPKQNQRQRHICGICGIELHSKEAAEAHVKNHKLQAVETGIPPLKPTALSSRSSSSSSSSIPTPPPSSQPSTKPKAKLMRCKRCQAIVEARHVKTHVCNSVKYNCTMCECSFGAEHLLVAHLETHSHTKKKPVPKPKSPKKLPMDDNHVVVLHSDSDAKDDDEVIIEEKQQSNAGYSCFVCDKMFIEEEEMKDHLQEHCEEVNDDINDKTFQCAFCGDKFQTEESLETHVGNHLQEDGEEKIHKLISEAKRDKPKKNLHKCDHCSETFPSSLLLAMHLPVHEDDVMDGELDHHVCTICDEIFDTSEELSEHLDVHNGNTHVCILCEKSFSSIRDLQEHVSTHL